MQNYFIIDHNINTVKKIKTVLHDFPKVTCIGISENKDDALNLILKNTPDIIFINIDDTVDDYPRFLSEIRHYCKKDFAFVALSDSRDQAYDTYKYDFFDYLLKPIVELSLRKCILKFKKKHPKKICNKICLKSYKDFHYLNTDEILFLKADNNTTDFHMHDGSIVSAYKTLKIFENRLPQNFLRIHKSYIINYCCPIKKVSIIETFFV